jgi:hypothetical protein
MYSPCYAAAPFTSSKNNMSIRVRWDSLPWRRDRSAELRSWPERTFELCSLPVFPNTLAHPPDPFIANYPIAYKVKQTRSLFPQQLPNQPKPNQLNLSPLTQSILMAWQYARGPWGMNIQIIGSGNAIIFRDAENTKTDDTVSLFRIDNDTKCRLRCCECRSHLIYPISSPGYDRLEVSRRTLHARYRVGCSRRN